MTDFIEIIHVGVVARRLRVGRKDFQRFFPKAPSGLTEASHYLHRQKKRRTAAWGAFVGFLQAEKKWGEAVPVSVDYSVHDSEWLEKVA